jgi:hypothetical protein
MQINRTAIITGPCKLTYGGQSFWSKGDVVLKPIIATNPVGTSAHGPLGARYTSRSYEVTFEPDGRFNLDLAAILWPYASTSIGAGIYGSSDTALVILGRSNDQITLHNARLTEMPVIRLGTSLTVAGSCKFTALLKNNTAPSDAAAYYSVATGTYSDTGFDPTEIITPAPTAAWGDVTGFTSFLTEGGWEFAFAPQLSPVLVDGLGVVDMTLTGLTATARAIPVGPTLANLMAATGNAMDMGSALDAFAGNLTVAGTGLEVVLYNAAITDTDAGWGTTRKRLGATTWTAQRTVTDGTLDPLFTITDGAEE